LVLIGADHSVDIPTAGYRSGNSLIKNGRLPGAPPSDLCV
jgi:hypothetical protein